MFSEKLKDLRSKSKITQKDFAKIQNVGSSTVAMWETNQREPDFDTLKKIADYFNVTTDYLLDKEQILPQNTGVRICERLKLLREEKNLSKAQLARVLKITYGTYNHYEVGDREPNSDYIKIFSRFYGVSADYIMGGTKERDINIIQEKILTISGEEEDIIIAMRERKISAERLRKLIDLIQTQD